MIKLRKKTPSKKPYKFFSFGHKISSKSYLDYGTPCIRIFTANKSSESLKEICVATHSLSKYEEVESNASKESLIELISNNLNIRQWFLLYAPGNGKFPKLVLDTFLNGENFCITFKVDSEEKNFKKYFRPKATGVTEIFFAYYNYKLGKFTHSSEVFVRI